MFHNILMTVCDSFAIIFLILSINEYKRAAALFKKSKEVWNEIAENMNSEETIKEDN